MRDLRTSRESGAALLTVLMLVAIMAAIAAVVLGRLTVATRLSANGVMQDQVNADMQSALGVVGVRAEQLSRSSTATTQWIGHEQKLDVGGADVRAILRDGSGCFNLNSVVTGDGEADLSARPIGIFQLRTLLTLVGTTADKADAISSAVADWIDSDSVPLPDGAEDTVYLRARQPYRTANRFMRDPSELRAVQGVTPDIYALVRPWVCTLPTADLTSININTVSPEEAPLLAMLFNGNMSVAMARELLLRRPAAGWSDTGQFLALLVPSGIALTDESSAQLVTESKWIIASITARRGDAVLSREALFDARSSPFRLVAVRAAEDGQQE